MVRSVCAGLAVVFIASGCARLHTPTGDPIALEGPAYRLVIHRQGFRYGFERPDGRVVAPPHPVSGLRFGSVEPEDAHTTEVLERAPASARLRVTTVGGKRAVVSVRLDTHTVRLRIMPEGEGPFVIDARTAALAPAYGLGDHGGYGRSTDVFGFRDDNFHNTDNGRRFVSTFTVFPAQGFGQVLFEPGRKRVAVDSTENRLGAHGVRQAALYYFVGSMKDVYRSYKVAREEAGYSDARPKPRFFDLGYEAFGSLGWNTFQQSVEEDIRRYLAEGYPLRWAVVGSGFWKGSRKQPDQGATTSFGIWDDAPEAGRNDGLPNPRYPDPEGFGRFFRERGIELYLGLRINFKALPERGGYYHPPNDGPYTPEGLARGFLRTGPDTFRVNFPAGSVYLLDGANPAAVDWFASGAARWGADGFKEDTMLGEGDQLYDDAKLNAVNLELMRRGNAVMVRNAAYAVPGDILRLEDTKYGFDQDRPVINALNYAASGASAVYTDIVAGKYLMPPLTPDQKRYFIRNALFAAVTPVMAMGLGPWRLDDDRLETAVRKAALWHHRHALYIYSAVLQSYETGFPHAMTPLPVAYPNDPVVYGLANDSTRGYAWMLGPSMLAVPAYGDDYATALSRDVYLPTGTWIDPDTGVRYEGPRLLRDYPLPDDKIPVFIGGEGVVVERHGDDLYAVVYPVGKGARYAFIWPDGKGRSTITHDGQPGSVTDLTSGQSVPGEPDVRTGALRFPIQPGRDYRVDVR